MKIRWFFIFFLHHKDKHFFCNFQIYFKFFLCWKNPVYLSNNWKILLKQIKGMNISTHANAI